MLYLKPTEDMWGLDVEGDGLEPTRLWCVCLINLKSGEELTFIKGSEFRAWLKNNPLAVFITHNGLKGDIPWLNELWKTGISYSRTIDTIVLSQLFDPNLPKPEGCGESGTHSLKAWGIRVKLPKSDFNDFSKRTQEMIDYCLQDVRVTLKVYKQLVSKLKKLKFTEKSVELEHQVAPIIGEQQRNGFEFDREGAVNLRDTLRGQQSSLQRDIHEVFPPRLRSAGVYGYKERKDGSPFVSYVKHTERYPEIKWVNDTSYECFDYETFNIGSPAQRLARLLELGYKPTVFTKKGNPKIDEDALLEFAEASGISEIKFIANWLVLEGRANMIDTWLNNLGSDNRIHGNIFTCGAQSRRMKHSAPNTANIPGLKAKYGHDVRALWLARPNRMLVGVDASGLEGRMLLHHLNNPDAEAFFLGDPHQQNSDALQAAGINADRHDAKQLFYAFLYGAGDAKLGAMLRGASAAVGTKIRSTLQSTVPGLGQLLERIHAEWKSNSGLLRCIDGGFVRCPSKSAALNYKLQPDGAILMKEALVIAAPKVTELGGLFVGNIHDEWQVDCDPSVAEEIGRVGTEAITAAGVSLGFNVPLGGDFKVGKNWAETH